MWHPTFVGCGWSHFSPPLVGGLTPYSIPLLLVSKVRAPLCHLDLSLQVSAPFVSSIFTGRSLRIDSQAGLPARSVAGELWVKASPKGSTAGTISWVGSLCACARSQLCLRRTEMLGKDVRVPRSTKEELKHSLWEGQKPRQLQACKHRDQRTVSSQACSWEEQLPTTFRCWATQVKIHRSTLESEGEWGRQK